MSDDIPHLRQIAQASVDTLVQRAIQLAPDSYTIRLEAHAFKESRTPWDATRLGNALWHHAERTPAVTELVRDIDVAAEDCAEFVPPNRDSERL